MSQQAAHDTKKAPKTKKGTAITFTPDELLALARFVAAGAIMLQTKHPVTTRIKGALTRLRLQVPPGL